MPSSRNSSSKGGFPTLGLSETLLSAVTALGYEEPTPVQRETIPVMLARQRPARPGRHWNRQDRRLRPPDDPAPH